MRDGVRRMTVPTRPIRPLRCAPTSTPRRRRGTPCARRRERLDAAGFAELDEREPWADVPDAGYVVRGGALIAWRRPAGAGAAAGAHRRRPHRLARPARQAAPRRRAAPGGASSASRSTAACCSTAGSTATSASPAGSCSPTARDALVDVAEPIARVPQLAIHLDRDVNERGLVLDRQAHMTPVWATALDDAVRAVDRRAGRHAGPGGVGAVPVRRAAGGRARRRPLAARQRPARQPGVVLGGDDARWSPPSRPSTWR